MDLSVNRMTIEEVRENATISTGNYRSETYSFVNPLINLFTMTIMKNILFSKACFSSDDENNGYIGRYMNCFHQLFLTRSHFIVFKRFLMFLHSEHYYYYLRQYQICLQPSFFWSRMDSTFHQHSDPCFWSFEIGCF